MKFIQLLQAPTNLIQNYEHTPRAVTTIFALAFLLICSTLPKELSSKLGQNAQEQRQMLFLSGLLDKNPNKTGGKRKEKPPKPRRNRKPNSAFVSQLNSNPKRLQNIIFSGFFLSFPWVFHFLYTFSPFFWSPSGWANSQFSSFVAVLRVCL